MWRNKRKAFSYLIICVIIFWYLKMRDKVLLRHPKFNLLGPFDVTKYQVVPNYNKLYDINNFNFTLNPDPCHKHAQGILLVIIVSSNPKNFDKRLVIRNTWGQGKESTKIVFLFGETQNKNVSNLIKNESFMYGDIVQGTFIDTYRNMTYKHVMGLKWVAHHCPLAKYVLKVDDDVVVHSNTLRQFLVRTLSPWGARNLIICSLQNKAKVMRTATHKWFVSEKEYPKEYYPSYCAGFAILYSQDVVRRLLEASQKIPYFWIDDVAITGMAAEIVGVERSHLFDLLLYNEPAYRMMRKYSQIVGPYIVGPWDKDAQSMVEIWESLPK